MATIKSTLALQDNMSKTLSSITKAMDSTLKAVQRVKGAKLGAEFTAAAADIKSAQRAVDGFNAKLDQMDGKLQKSNTGLASAVTSLVGWYSVLNGLKSAVNLSDEYMQTQARLNMIKDDTQTVASLQDEIYAAAQRSRGSYTAMADSVAKLQMRAGAIFKTNKETIQFTENLNKIYAIGGTAQQEMASATLQLTQALGSGVLRGEEFNAVFEAAPLVMQKVADYIGKPIGELRTLAADGKISAEIVKNALLGATDDINAQFKEMPLTFSQVWTKFLNSLQKIAQPALKILNSIVTPISKLFEFLGEHQYILYAIAGGIALIAGSILVYNTYTSIAAVVTAIWASEVGKLWLKFALGIIIILAVVSALLYLWNTNDDVAYGMLMAWDGLLIGLATFGLGAKSVFYSILDAISYMKITGIWIVTGFVNSMIMQINRLIELVNMIPGISIDTIGYVTDWAVEQTAAENEKIAGRAQEIAADAQSIVAETQERNASRDSRVQNRKKIGMGNLPEGAGGSSSDWSLPNGADLIGSDGKGGKALKTTSNDDLLSDEDIKLLLDVATRDYKLNYQQITPNVSVTFGDVRETADVDEVLNQVGARIEELVYGDAEVPDG